MKPNEVPSIDELNRRYWAGQLQAHLDEEGIQVSDEDARRIYEACEFEIHDVSESDGFQWNLITGVLVDARDRLMSLKQKELALQMAETTDQTDPHNCAMIDTIRGEVEEAQKAFMGVR